MRKQSITERFWSHVHKSDGCWLWTGYTDKDGYGTVGRDGKVERAHRVAWILTHGPIPDGMYVCHTCDTPACCRLDHLWLGTNADNLRDRDAKGRGKWHRGERHYRAQLTDENVRAIRQRRAEGWTYARIAANFHVAPGNAHHIVTRKKWKHVT